MHVDKFSFGTIQIDGSSYEHDVIIDRGKISKRKKGASKPFRSDFGHTPVSMEEKIPWKCKRLIIGTGAHGALPVMKDVVREARKRDVDLVIAPTEKAVKQLNKSGRRTNAILHVTC